MSATIPHSTGAVCPSCGRFVGPLEKCPYCGAQIQKRLPLSVLKLACLILAVAGVAILVYAVSGTATPTTKIGNVGATMNYAFVRIEGTVTRGPLYDAEEKTLRFYVADETGEIQATAFRDVTESLVEQRKIPSIGDKIVLDGTLRVRDDFTSLNVAAADKVTLTPPASERATIFEIGVDDEMRFVQIQGDVRAIRKPYDGLTLITIGAEAGEIDVAVSGDIEKLYGGLPQFGLGDVVSAQGVVTLFRGEPQMSVRQPNDLQNLGIENTAAQVRKIGELKIDALGQRIRVTGNIGKISKFSQGVRITIQDETGEIPVVIWQDVFDEMEKNAGIVSGLQIEVVGQITEYRGELEIVPQQGSDIAIRNAQSDPAQTSVGVRAAELQTPDSTATLRTTATPRPTRVPTIVPVVRTIKSITPNDKDVRVILTATITDANLMDVGTRYLIDDGTGRIALLIWKEVFDTIPSRHALVPGTKIRVTGTIDLFNKTLEIIPSGANDLEILEKAVVTPLAVRAVSSISTEDLGKVVLVQGTALEIADFSAGKYVTLQDESSKIRIVVFNNALEPIKDKLVVGGSIKVRGKVNVFAGKFEVVAEEVTFP